MIPNKLVSIAVLTYNHEKFIEQAIHSFLSQKTNFDFEIVIGDDASTDNTQEILKGFQEKYPDKFNIAYHKNNIGMLPNFIDVINRCNGKYIAFCEGDDYWVDSNKLQIQTDFLESNEDYAICFHEAEIFDETLNILKPDDITTSAKQDYNLDDLVKDNFMHTPTVMLRNDFSLPKDFNTLPIGDWPLYIFMLKSRKIRKLNKVMSVYRVHSNNSWSSKPFKYRLKKSINTINYLIERADLETEQKEHLRKTLKSFKRKLFRSRYKFWKKDKH